MGKASKRDAKFLDGSVFKNRNEQNFGFPQIPSGFHFATRRNASHRTSIPPTRRHSCGLAANAENIHAASCCVIERKALGCDALLSDGNHALVALSWPLQHHIQDDGPLLQ